jgi:ubiquinone biosynthesis protein UbiJ
MAANDTLPLALLERGLNHSLRDSPAAARLLQQWKDQALALHAEELGRTLYLVAHPAGLQVLTQADRPAQATLSGTLIGLSRLAAGSASGRLPPGVHLSGEIEVAERFQGLLTLARPDFEALLAHALGDALAHTLGTRLRRMGRWVSRSLFSLGQDASEYLRYETDLLPDRSEVMLWIDEVDRLRDDVARLAARVEQLQQSSPKVHVQAD